MYKIVLNPNEDIVKEVKLLVEQNEGYCPCAIVKDEDSKCICKAFREKEELGECHCGLYVKVEE